MDGSAKISSGASESSSATSAGSSSSGSGSATSASSSRGSGSSSCQCAFEVTDITLVDAMNGTYTITNTGCGEIQIYGHEQSEPDIIYIVGDLILSEGESTSVIVGFGQDVRLTSFTVQTSCGDQNYQWPSFP